MIFLGDCVGANGSFCAKMIFVFPKMETNSKKQEISKV